MPNKCQKLMKLFRAFFLPFFFSFFFLSLICINDVSGIERRAAGPGSPLHTPKLKVKRELEFEKSGSC